MDVEKLRDNDGGVQMPGLAGESAAVIETSATNRAQTLADLVTTAARRWPDRAALATPGGDITFAEADRRIERIRSGLGVAGVGRGDRVPVAMHKTHEAYLIFHALLRLGAIVIPIDPLMPVASASTLIQSLEPVAMIVDQATLRRLDPGRFELGIFTVDGDGEEEGVRSLASIIATESASPAPPERDLVQPNDVAYVIFTSGSTGAPKGISHTHRSALAYAELAVDVHQIREDDRLAGISPLHFDMSTLELYAAPLAGAACVPIGGAEVRFPASFTERSEAERLTIWYAVPFQLRMISERGALDQRDLAALRHVIYAGEPFSVPALRDLMHQLPGVRFSNAYGPAETNVCTVHELESPPDADVPIGQPWGGVEIRLVSPDADVGNESELVDVPDGELGELWVQADTVMVGYLDRPDLTAERLVAPASGNGPSWYRTGDLGRRFDGVLHLAGRIDHQVKVRGVRLELEAIESVLAANPDVADAVVAPVGGGQSAAQLTAAIVAGPSGADPDVLRRWCLERLPQVAVPIDVKTWDSFPLTSSGKIDRAAVRRSLLPPNAPTESSPDV